MVRGVMLLMIGQSRRGAVLSAFVAMACVAAAPSVARATAITEFSSGLNAGSDLGGIEAGPDRNLWFTDGGTTRAIGRITPSGAIRMFTAGLNGGGKPTDITLGPDGNLWFTETGSPNNAIGRVTPEGMITEFKMGLGSGSAPVNIVVGPDNNLWFLDVGTTKAIGRITPAGTIKEFSTGLNPLSQPNDLTVGADGNLWFTDQGNTKAIGRVTTAGTIKEFSTGLDALNSFPNELTSGADGNVWFSDDGSSAIGRVTPSGTITEFKNGLFTGSQPDALIAAPDGNVWFTDQLSGHRAIGRITSSGKITEFSSGLDPTSLQDDITVGADGNLWIEQSMPGGIARITTGGVITQFTAGLNMGAGNERDQLVAGPDGNLWFTDDGTTKAIGRVALQLPPAVSTGAASAVSRSTAKVSGSVNPRGSATTVTVQYGTTPALKSTAAAGTLAASGDPSTVTAALSGLPPGTVIYYRVVAANGFGTTNGGTQTFEISGTASPPRPQSTSAKFGNQQITLTTPSLRTCTAKTKTLTATLRSTAIPKSHRARLLFVSAAFYLDKGVKHTHKKTERLRNGRKKTVIVVVYTANAIARHVPLTLARRVAGLRSGSHTLKVVLSYREQVSRHGHTRTVTVTETLSAKFRVC